MDLDYNEFIKSCFHCQFLNFNICMIEDEFINDVEFNVCSDFEYDKSKINQIMGY